MFPLAIKAVTANLPHIGGAHSVLADLFAGADAGLGIAAGAA